MRSKLCWDIFQKVGIVSSRASHAKLYINGSYYGLYISIEHIDDSFVAKNYSNGSGNLWKCVWPADLTYRGNSPGIIILTIMMNVLMNLKQTKMNITTASWQD